MLPLLQLLAFPRTLSEGHMEQIVKLPSREAAVPSTILHFLLSQSTQLQATLKRGKHDGKHCPSHDLTAVNTDTEGVYMNAFIYSRFIQVCC